MNTSAQAFGYVHRYLPPSGDDPRTLLLLHGTGGDENDLIPLAARIAPERTILSPRGQSLDEGLTRFFRRFPDGRWDVSDLRRRTPELAEFVRRACAAYQIANPIALGYSNGANIGWSLLLHDPGLLAGAILMRAMLPFDPRPLPDLSGIPVLILAGTYDELIPIEQAGLLAAMLGEAGADVAYETLHAGHGLTPEDLKLAAEWLVHR